MGLRPPHEQALHAQGEAAPACGPGRLRRLLPAGRTPQREPTWSAENEGNEGRLESVRVRRIGEARQAEPGPPVGSGAARSKTAKTCSSPRVLAAEIVEDLHAALQAFQAIARELEPAGAGTA